ncbi:MAG: hypothetical protein HY941_04965 [Gammaproteobacteria bacterium]|nr:hypothetical protein [Gammaproteobacteria bacterium]
MSVPPQQAIPGVDTRPAPLREWLTALPYVDAENTTTAVLERLRDINHQRIPAAHRLELLEAFRHSYERLHDALRDNARLHDPQTLPRALTLLTELTEALSFGYKYALRDAGTERPRWGRNKQLPEALNYTLHFLALLLLCRYQAYQPVSDQHWREIGDLVRFAEAQPIENTRDADFPYSTGELHALTGYRQLALLRLADPYRLPSGLIWEAYGYLAGKTGQSVLLVHFDGADTTGVYALSLDSEPHQSRPAPTSGVERSSWRWLDARELLRTAQQDLERIQAGSSPQRVGFSNRLTSSDAIQLLGRMLGQWTHTPQRKSPRFASATDVDLAPGLDAAYYFLNNCVAFDPRDYAVAEDDDDIDFSLSARRAESNLTREFRLVSCPTRNRSGGGLALHLDQLHGLGLRVGQLVVINAPGTGTDTGSGTGRDWLVGVVRWLQNREEAGTEVGVQYVARNSQPVVVRATTGAAQHYHAALKSDLTLANGQRLPTLITTKGMFKSKTILELRHADQSRQIRCEHLLESGGGFDRFSYEAMD